MNAADLPERIAKRIAVNDVTGCWIWVGATNNGYGHVRWGVGTTYVHRLTYHLLADPSLPVNPGRHGDQLDHICWTKLCVNPNHVEPVSASENVQRYWARPNVRLTNPVVELIRERGPLASREVADLLNIPQTHACNMLLRLTRQGRLEVVGRRRATGGRSGRLYAAALESAA